MNAIKTPPPDFRTLLQQELMERCRKNPRYSLRSFSKSLKIQSSALAEMLNGKRTITKKSIEKLGFELGLPLNEMNRYLANKGVRTTRLGKRELNYRQISIDEFSVISDWYHYAIIELLKVKKFQTTPAWIARALGITKSEANFAIERLLRLGLLARGKAGDLKDTSSGFSTNISGNITSAGSKRLQKKILEQSIDALMELPIESRNHTSMTMAIDSRLLPEAIEKIKTFRRDLCAYLESKGEPNEVYQLCISLFPVTQLAAI